MACGRYVRTEQERRRCRRGDSGRNRLTRCSRRVGDAGVENVKAQIDALLATGLRRRLLAMTELKCSNSMLEAWWRSLKHHWLFLHALDSVATVRRLLAFYVDEHNRVLPHAAFRGETPDEMYFGTGNEIAEELAARARPRRAGHACRPTDQ